MSSNYLKLFNRQKKLQKDVFGYGKELSELPMQQRLGAIKDFTLAATDELHEALNEAGWKPWATRKFINEEAFKSELVDVFLFLLNLWFLGGGEADELIDKALAKQQKNILRQSKGYDGVFGKCPKCHRAYDDTAVNCREGFCENEPN